MKAIVLNNICYCKYPAGIESIEQFTEYCNQHFQSFLKLTKYIDENCNSKRKVNN